MEDSDNMYVQASCHDHIHVGRVAENRCTVHIFSLHIKKDPGISRGKEEEVEDCTCNMHMDHDAEHGPK